jgi:hypothetical protein
MTGNGSPTTHRRYNFQLDVMKFEASGFFFQKPVEYENNG